MQQTLSNIPTKKITHGERIRNVVDLYSINSQSLNKDVPTITKRDRTLVFKGIAELEAPFTRDGVDFSRINFEPLLKHFSSGSPIEFETLGPYLEAYKNDAGIMNQKNLLPEDAIGLELSVVMRHFFPTARLISLCDDYNIDMPGFANETSSSAQTANFSKALSKRFRQSLVELYQSRGALTQNAIESVDYLLISESSKTADAEVLVTILDSQGHIQRKGEEIVFVNPNAENPLYRHINLRNSRGKWLCVALDAATFLKEENQDILHIIALPDYMKPQQDMVWEILRILGISPYRYHNIFYNPIMSPSAIAATVTDEFNRHLHK